MEDLPDDVGHSCDRCGYRMDKELAEVFDNLQELENFLIVDTKGSLVHIAGYATRKDTELSEEEMLQPPSNVLRSSRRNMVCLRMKLIVVS